MKDKRKFDILFENIIKEWNNDSWEPEYDEDYILGEFGKYQKHAYDIRDVLFDIALDDIGSDDNYVESQTEFDDNVDTLFAFYFDNDFGVYTVNVTLQDETLTIEGWEEGDCRITSELKLTELEQINDPTWIDNFKKEIRDVKKTMDSEEDYDEDYDEEDEDEEENE